MAAVDNLVNFHSCVQLGAALPSADNPGSEDRLALNQRSLWPNGSELIVNMWGYVPASYLFSLQLIAPSVKATSFVARSFNMQTSGPSTPT